MSREPGPREKALREMRESKLASKPTMPALKAAVAVASAKRGKPRKKK